MCQKGNGGNNSCMTIRDAVCLGCTAERGSPFGVGRRPALTRLCRLQARGVERGTLALGDLIDGEFFDRLAEEPMKIELGAQVQEYAAETDCRPVHENEL